MSQEKGILQLYFLKPNLGSFGNLSFAILNFANLSFANLNFAKFKVANRSFANRSWIFIINVTPHKESDKVSVFYSKVQVMQAWVSSQQMKFLESNLNKIQQLFSQENSTFTPTTMTTTTGPAGEYYKQCSQVKHKKANLLMLDMFFQFLNTSYIFTCNNST